LTLTVADLLVRRGRSDPSELERFLDPRLAHLSSPEAMADRDAAAERLVHAIRRRDKIAIFGDYDCDGITSAALMSDALRKLGADVVSLLANRFDGGYGVSAPAVARIGDSGAKLVVTCDCGSSDHQSLAELGARGLDIIVIDHHLVPAEPLPALAFLNPHRPDCGFAYKGLASCGLALSVIAAVRAGLGARLDLRRFLDLVAIGTIADVAPLDGDNRALVRAGLRVLREAERPGVRALLELCRVDWTAPFTGRDVAFSVAPRINAPGRLGSPDISLALLLAESLEEARPLAAQIEQLCQTRRVVQEQIAIEAVEDIERGGFADRAGIVVGRESWNPGIVGIVAGRLAARYARPVAVVGFDGEGRGRGSVRGPAGFRLYDALAECAEVLDRFGGHQAAAGLEVRLSRLSDLRACFESACTRTAQKCVLVSEGTELAWLWPEDDLQGVLSDLARLEPCGERNPAPCVAVQAKVVTAREVRGGHLKLELELAGGRRLAGFGVALGCRAAEIMGQSVVVGRLRADRFRGGDAVEIVVDQIHPAGH
jgi:single-stranded-DNA-specific exonuclease